MVWRNMREIANMCTLGLVFLGCKAPLKLWETIKIFNLSLSASNESFWIYFLIFADLNVLCEQL